MTDHNSEGEARSGAVGPGEPVLTRDLSSGRVHKRYPTASGEMATLEGDNLDEAGEYEVITAEQLADAEPGDLCENCFPSDVNE